MCPSIAVITVEPTFKRCYFQCARKRGFRVKRNTSLQPVGTQVTLTRNNLRSNWLDTSCRVFGELVFDEETWLFLESDAECFQLSVKLSSYIPLHFLCASQLSKKDNVVDIWEEKSVILARKLGRRNDRTSCCSPVRWTDLSLFLHGMNATLSAWSLSNDEGSFRWVIAASLLARKMQNSKRNWSFHGKCSFLPKT